MMRLDIKNGDIPQLYTNEETPVLEQVAYCKLYIPGSGIFWYLTEYDKETRVCYGIAHIAETEFGYFSLEEIEQLPYIVLVDEEFAPTLLGDIEELQDFISKFRK